MKRFTNELWVFGLSGLIVLTGLTGCSMWDGKKARETGRTVNQYKSDKATSDPVAEALSLAPVYKFPSVQVQTFEGNVQLSGFVHTQQQKQQAETIARQVPGVGNVINGLAIVPESPTPTGRDQGYLQNPTNQAPQVVVPANHPINTVPEQK
jgi:hyperosmotically inducible periplasmic protein